ncbi:MAG: AI-2E family transporter [Candidatus Anammoxibacter sp.]
MNNKKQKILENVWIKLIILTGVGVLFFVACGFLKSILISLFLAFTVAYIFDPIVDFIETRKKPFPSIRIPRTLAICILLAGITVATAGLLAYALPKTVNGVQQVGNTLKLRFPAYRSSIVELIDNYTSEEISLFLKGKLGIDGDWDISNESKQQNVEINKSSATEKDVTVTGNNGRLLESLINLKKYSPKVAKFLSNIATTVFESTFGIFGIIINFFIFGVVTVYLLRDFDSITAKVRDLVPASKRDKVSEIFLKIDVNLKEFFRGQITVCLILSLIYSIGLTIVGVPLSFVLGFVAGFGNVIPYVGTVVGLGLAMVITFFQFHDIQHLVLVGLVFGIGQLLEGILITPKIIGSKLGLSPVVVIISILIWSQLLGFLGLLLAVPFTSVAKVLIDEGISKYKKSSIYKKLP